MIPRFPEFKTVEVSDRAAVEVYTHQYPPYSDFNFTSLWAWDTSKERQISELDGNLVVRFTDYSTHEPFFSFLGTNEVERTSRTLLDHAKASGVMPELRLMPESSVNGIRSSVLRVEEDRDNFDYIYSVSAHSTLLGGDFKRNRNFVSRFERDNPTARIEIVDLGNTDAQKAISSTLRMWEEHKVAHEKDYELEHEEASILRLIETNSAHNLIVIAVFIEKDMAAFSIDEILPSQYSISHFWKADGNRAGIYDFLLRAKARHLETLGVALMNFEQDLGIEGLRRSKMSYRPASFLKKFRIHLVE